MAYVTNADIEERLGTALYVQLTDDTQVGSANEDLVDSVRTAVEAEADSYLARRYAVPIDGALHSEAVDVLRGFVLDLAEYRLHSRRPPIPQIVADKRARAVEWFNQIASGGVELPSTAEVEANSATGTTAKAIGDDRVLTREELADY